MIDDRGVQRAAIDHVGINIRIERPRRDVHGRIVVFGIVCKIFNLLTPGIFVQRVVGSAGRTGQNNELLIVLSIHLPAEDHLLLVVQALDPRALVLGAPQRRQQQSRQHGDGGGHHQHFNECKRVVAVGKGPSYLVYDVFHKDSEYYRPVMLTAHLQLYKRFRLILFVSARGFVVTQVSRNYADGLGCAGVSPAAFGVRPKALRR